MGCLGSKMVVVAIDDIAENMMENIRKEFILELKEFIIPEIIDLLTEFELKKIISNNSSKDEFESTSPPTIQ